MLLNVTYFTLKKSSVRELNISHYHKKYLPEWEMNAFFSQDTGTGR